MTKKQANWIIKIGTVGALSTLALGGCSSSSSSVSLHQLYKKQTAIAVVNVKTEKKLCAKTSFSLAKKTTRGDYPFRTVKIVKQDKPVQLIELAPGTYHIVNFHCEVRLGKKRWATDIGAPTDNKSYKFSLAKFTLRKGHITNIGQLVMRKPSFANKKVKLKVQDLSVGKLDWLKDNRPGHFKLMRKRLMTLTRKKISL